MATRDSMNAALKSVIAQYFCSLDDPEATRTWFVIDRRTGMPLFEKLTLRLFDRKEVDDFLASQQGAPRPD